MEPVDGALVVQWERAGSNASHYDLYRQTLPDGDWQRVASVGVVAVLEERESGGAYAWRDTTANPGATYRYGVVTIHYFGIRGPLVASAPVTAP